MTAAHTALSQALAAVLPWWSRRAADAQAAVERYADTMARIAEKVLHPGGDDRRVISFNVIELADPLAAPGMIRVEWEDGRGGAGEFHTDSIQQAMDEARRYALFVAGAMED